MSRSTSETEDERREQSTQSRMSKAHGGQTVESIAPEDVEAFNDAECKHEKFIRDETETEYNAFICANENCSEVLVFNKD